MIKSENIKVCVFDAYGTLFNVNSVVNNHLDKLGEKAEQVSIIWRQKQLEYSWLRSLMCKYEDFRTVTEEALDFAFNSCNIQNNSLREKLLDAYMHLDCYHEVPEVLFHSSNSWDVAGASSFGFQVAWVNRLGKSKETLPFKPDMEAKSLIEVSKVFKAR